MTFKAMIFTIAALIPSIGFADTISLSIPYEAASLHDGDVDMVVYYVDHPDHFEVVATYVSKTDLTSPSRMRMGLMDGDATNFALPGLTHLSYEFARDGDVVTVTATEQDKEFASNELN